VMINVIGSQRQPGELLQQVALFIAGAVGTDNPDRVLPTTGDCILELCRDQIESLFPSGGVELAIRLNQGLLQAVGMIGEIEGVASLDAEEVAVDAALVAIVAAHNLHTR